MASSRRPERSVRCQFNSFHSFPTRYDVPSGSHSRELPFNFACIRVTLLVSETVQIQRTRCEFLPDQHLGWVVLTNVDDQALPKAIREIVYANLLSGRHR
jgi:hypothetical protein